MAHRQLPVCPRHPDRPSFIRCQRCSRPACPECQRPAAVGIHCADCVAGRGPAHTTGPRGLGVGGPGVAPHAPGAGGRRPGDSGPAPDRWATARRPRWRTPDQPWVTWTMIGICAVVYVLQFLTSGQRTGVTEQFWYAGMFTSAVAMEPWRMLTAAFLHSPGNPLHILLNLFTLWMMGRVLEPVLGWARFLALYLVSAFGGSVAVLWLSAPNVPVVGASGAVYGLFAALFIVLRRTGGNVSSIVALIGVNLAISFMGANISWQGHIGGLLAGAACAAVFAYVPDGRRGPALRQWLVLAGVVVVLVVLAVLGALRLTPETLLQLL
ncbi:rhomboid family intramembrane serine protease [Citricoccus sp.]|uniref:rhomboid family intramembrane serine protease n=1 Tax=Citricoccus sp. TaxID=1978372 RepID=UPI00261C880F|nr:rhomboid family intramembrane serine protease [Citricoccus sp.]HRO30388.1 rhomboid family intramembrane serine protease [Citricoccus sp.]HRO92454.1 rhomboid family intramembrane serine protease [Citricoccus sp.]